MEKNGTELDLPGFRFHPTEEELLDFYLRKMVDGIRLNFDIIGTINLYQHDPWELPGLAKIGEWEWYFFVPRDRKQANGGRPNRTTERGFWKATGSDRPIRSAADPKRLIGLKKTLVYYKGRAPRGTKTDWVMNEYRLPDDASSSSSSSVGPPPLKEDSVICKVYRKATTMKELEQRAAIEEENTRGSQCIASMLSDIPFVNFQDLQDWAPIAGEYIPNELTKTTNEGDSSSSAVSGSVGLQDIEVLEYNNIEWSHDSFLNQLRSPWVDLWSPYADILNL